MRQRLQRWLKNTIRKIGFDVVHFSNNYSDYVVKNAIRSHEISTILDVGANRGQFAKHALDYGFRGTIHSFEPFPAAFSGLVKAARSHPHWHAHPVALARVIGIADLNIGANDQTCSLRSTLAGVAEAIPDLQSAGRVEVATSTLDAFLDSQRIDAGSCFLKLDVQGSERDVLAGGAAALSRVPLLQVETAITPTYEGETQLSEMIDYVHDIGMVVRAFRDVFASPTTGELMQVDLIAERPR